MIPSYNNPLKQTPYLRNSLAKSLTLLVQGLWGLTVMSVMGFFLEHVKGNHSYLVYLPETDEEQSGKILYYECS